MTPSEKIKILQDEFLEAIETKKPEIARRFIIHLTEKQDRDKEDILHSIELLAQQMSSMQKDMNTRFEAVDKRFEAVDKRFEAADKRFEAMDKHMNQRFEAVDKRFETMDKHMNQRFEAVDKRFDDMNRRFTQLTWFIGVIFLALSLMMTIFKFIK